MGSKLPNAQQLPCHLMQIPTVTHPHPRLNMILAGWGSSATNSTQLYLPRLSASFKGDQGWIQPWHKRWACSQIAGADLHPNLITSLGDVIPAIPYIKHHQAKSSPTMHMANKWTEGICSCLFQNLAAKLSTQNVLQTSMPLATRFAGTS